MNRAPTGQPYQSIGTSAHAFSYWGFDFITELLGVSGSQSLNTFDVSMADATQITKEVWQQGGYSAQTLLAIFDSEEMIRFHRINLAAFNVMAILHWLFCSPTNPGACVLASIYTGLALMADSMLQKEHARLDELRRDKVRLGNFLYHPAFPERVVMLTHRDGSRALAAQSGSLIRQVAVFYQNLIDNWFDPDMKSCSSS